MKSNFVSVGLFRANCYIVSDISGFPDAMLVIDPGDHYSYLKTQFEKPPTHVIITHYHPDHIGALAQLKEEYGNAVILTGIHEPTDRDYVVETTKAAAGAYFSRMQFSNPDFFPVQPDMRLKDGDSILGFEVIETPGHSLGSICLYNKAEKVLYTGDTLFRHTCGRTDFPGGNPDEMMKSLKKLLSLPPDVQIFPGHEERTSVEEERKFWGFEQKSLSC